MSSSDLYEKSCDDILNLICLKKRNQNQLKMSSSDSPISSATLAVTALYASPSSSESCDERILMIALKHPGSILMITLLKTTWAGAGVDLVGGVGPKMSSNVANVDLQDQVRCSRLAIWSMFLKKVSYPQ